MRLRITALPTVIFRGVLVGAMRLRISTKDLWSVPCCLAHPDQFPPNNETLAAAPSQTFRGKTLAGAMRLRITACPPPNWNPSAGVKRLCFPDRLIGNPRRSALCASSTGFSQAMGREEQLRPPGLMSLQRSSWVFCSVEYMGTLHPSPLKAKRAPLSEGKVRASWLVSCACASQPRISESVSCCRAHLDSALLACWGQNGPTLKWLCHALAHPPFHAAHSSTFNPVSSAPFM